MTMEQYLYRKQGRGVVAARRSRLYFVEAVKERGLIQFWLELVSYRLSIRWVPTPLPLAHSILFSSYR